MISLHRDKGTSAQVDRTKAQTSGETVQLMSDPYQEEKPDAYPRLQWCEVSPAQEVLCVPQVIRVHPVLSVSQLPRASGGNVGVLTLLVCDELRDTGLHSVFC